MERVPFAFDTSMDVRVGIGLSGGDPREKAVLASVAFCPLYVYRSSAEMMEALAGSQVDAVVRGSLPSDGFLAALRERHPRVRPRRIALLLPSSGRPFLLGPVGIDEGGTLREMERIIRDMREFCALLSWEPRISVLSAGRPADVGRSARIASSVRRGEVLAGRHGVRHCNIMIEEALQWANCVIAPDGVSGNLVYRTLAHLGGAVSLGALYFPLGLRLADTSRNGTVDEYVGAVALANLAAGHLRG